MAKAPSLALIDYLTLRKLVGFIALGLPFALMIGEAIVHPGPLPASVSDYFYTPMQRVLVGALCTIGTFLITYRGYGVLDFIPMKVMAAAAIGVAFFPTVPALPSPSDNVVGLIHGICAGVLFGTMTVTCLFLFTKSSGQFSWQRSARKRQRNGVYVTLGILMATALVLVPILTHIKAIAAAHPMFCLETTAIECFGLSWSVKGQALLPDRKA
jgi:hypothetical protein